MEVEHDLKLDRKNVSFTSHETLRKEDREYWRNASIEEKIGMINYLRECFYGVEAATGRLQRFFEFVEQERG
jgi:hypothetical protein